MNDKSERPKWLCRGNRTEVLLLSRDGVAIVQKKLLLFADVSTERQGLFYEALVQRAARGPGVVPIRDERFDGQDRLSTSRPALDEVRSIERGYIAGCSLKELLAEKYRTQLTPDRCRAWIATLLSTLNRVHQLAADDGSPLGLVHRDVTLGNVLVSHEAIEGPPREGNVWLNDFGIAHLRAWGPLPLEETLQGSRRFLSPELKAGEQPTCASDVYQAALLFAALLNTSHSRSLERLFDEGFSNPVNEEARSLLKPWGADDALDATPANRPSASELAALLLM